MRIDDVVAYLAGLQGTLLLRPQPGDGSPDIAWGDVFCYYAPDGVVPNTQPFATVVTKDYPNEPTWCRDRPGAFRVNIDVGAAEFRRWTCHDPREPAVGEQDLSAENAVMAHPVYAALGWLCVVNPGPQTEAAVQEMLRTASDLARGRYQRRAEAGQG